MPDTPDILDRLLGQPHTTSEPSEVTAQREALMADVVNEIRRLRQLVGQTDAIRAAAHALNEALDAYEKAQEDAEKAAEQAAKDAAEKTKAEADKAKAADDKAKADASRQPAQAQPHR